MKSNVSLFALKDKQYYKNTPYFKTNIEINNGINSTITIGLVVNSLTGQVNLTKLFQELQNGVKNKKKNFMDWRYLLETMKYTDCYSLMKYGHVHYYYDGKPIYDLSVKKNTDDTDDNSDNNDEVVELSLNNIKDLRIRAELTNKGKVVKTSLITEAKEIFGEIYNKYPNECKGQYGDYHLINRMMNYISFNYEVINNEFIAFILPLLSSDNTNMIKEMSSPEIQINALLDENIPDESDIKKNILNEDEELIEIMKIDNSKKGKLAEKWTENYMKQWIPDIKSCADTKESCDLYSESLGIRVEVKCRNESEKIRNGLNKFHRDVKIHENDTKLFIYLDLCKTSTIDTRIEISPLRLYLNGSDLNEKMMKFIVSTCKSYNKMNYSEYTGEIDSNIVLKSARKNIEEGFKQLRDLYIVKTEELINEILTKNEQMNESGDGKATNEIKINADEPTNEIKKNDIAKNENSIIPTNNEEIKRIKMIPGVDINRLMKHALGVKEFIEANKDKFVIGYYVSKSYDFYLNWCKTNLRQTLLRREFDTVMKNLCINKRISTDPYTGERTNLHYWIVK